jgi:hypothetical protein
MPSPPSVAPTHIAKLMRTNCYAATTDIRAKARDR